MSRKLRKEENETLTAVALQDHLVKSLNINLSLSNPLGYKKSLSKKLAYCKPTGKAVVDTNRNSKHSTKGTKTVVKEQEYVLDIKPPPLTLAQKLGLVEQPKQLMDEVEWLNVKEKAKKRQDFDQPCVICKEDVGKSSHVLLSCSHVFHRNCLQAFERFSGKKTCPMCRKEQYQTRVVYDGSPFYKHKCASRIQALWRGYVVRCWYKKLRETVPPKDPILRQKFYEEKLCTITDRMIKSMDMNVNAFLYEVDNNLEVSRRIFQQFDCQNNELTDDQWIGIYRKAVERQEAECPICLTTVNFEGEGKKNTLTSCSHLFHDTCLQMFETLAEEQGSTHSCPVCRSAYQKRLC